MDVHSDDVSYAFNINTPEPVIAKLKEAFNKRMKDGSMDGLFKQYGLPSSY